MASAPKPEKSLAMRSLQGSLGVFLSRISGILRSVVLNSSFGAGIALDAFFIALRIPSSLRDLLADGALSSAATTVLAEQDESSDDFSKTFIKILIAFLLVTLAISGVSAIFSYEVVKMLVEDGYPETGLQQASRAFQVLAFYLPVALFSALCMAVLSIQGKLLRATVASSFFNVGAVFGALVLSPLFDQFGRTPSLGLTWGTLLGGLAQCFYLGVPLRKTGQIQSRYFWIALTTEPFWKSTEVARVFKMILPRTAGQGAIVLGMMVSTFYATSLGPGYLTYLTNTMILVLVPVGLFGVAGGYAALPLLTQARAEKNPERFWALLSESLELVSFLSAFSVCGLVLLADPLLVLMFEYGSFFRKDVIVNATTLIAFAVSIWFSAQAKIQSQALFAIGKTSFVAVNSFVFIGIQVACYSAFVKDYGIFGMGLSSVFASGVSWFASVFVLQRYADRHDKIGIKVLSRSQITGLALAFSAVSLVYGLRRGVILEHLADPLYFTRFHAILVLAVGGLALGLVWCVGLIFWGPASLRNRLPLRIRTFGRVP